MRAYEFSEAFGLENLQMIERPDPVPGPGQALVRVRACSLNYRDLMVSKGQYGRGAQAPLVPLSDAAGEVIAMGPSVSGEVARVKVGDRVAGCFFQSWLEGDIDDAKSATALGGAIQGVLAEQVCLNANGLVKIPDHLTFEEAATLPCAGVTTWNALFRSGNLRAGETVLTQGTGGVSIFAVQFAKMAGARVISTSSSDEKLGRVRSLGADETINYKKEENWERPAVKMTGGVGVDHVVEVGGAGTLSKSVRAVRRAGHIALIGVLTGGEFDPRPLLVKSIRVQGIYVGSREMFEEMNRAISLAKLKPVIDKVFPFEDARQAYEHMESAAHFGKICISV